MGLNIRIHLSHLDVQLLRVRNISEFAEFVGQNIMRVFLKLKMKIKSRRL
jgi:hypothetical protein